MMEFSTLGIYKRLSFHLQFSDRSISNPRLSFKPILLAILSKSPFPAKGSKAIFAFVDFTKSKIWFLSQRSFSVKNCPRVRFRNKVCMLLLYQKIAASTTHGAKIGKVQEREQHKNSAMSLLKLLESPRAFFPKR